MLTFEILTHPKFNTSHYNNFKRFNLEVGRAIMKETITSLYVFLGERLKTVGE